MNNVITENAIKKRHYWIEQIAQMNGDFSSNSTCIEERLSAEINKEGLPALLDHLRLCSAIPESYGHDTSEEKLYAKYTDALISEAYSYIGLTSNVLTERSNCADVEVVGDAYSFVADAKVFRLSRTAKNQKDFKITSMDKWKHGKPYAMVVCPLYQLPARSSQIYEQASSHNVCIFSYPHLAVLAQLVGGQGKVAVIDLLHKVFKNVEAMNPSKDAISYWQAINREILNYDSSVSNFWNQEKMTTIESIKISKDIALSYYSSQREEIMKLSHKAALKKLIDMHKIDSRIKIIESVSDNSLMLPN